LFHKLFRAWPEDRFTFFHFFLSLTIPWTVAGLQCISCDRGMTQQSGNVTLTLTDILEFSEPFPAAVKFDVWHHCEKSGAMWPVAPSATSNI